MFQNFLCIKVPLCPRVKVPLYTCTMYRSVKVPLYPCIKVPLYPCIKVPLYPCIKVPLYPCISVPMCLVLCPTARQLLPKQSRQRFIVTYPCGQSTHALTTPYSIAVPVHHGTSVSCPVPDSPSVAAQAEPAAVHCDLPMWSKYPCINNTLQYRCTRASRYQCVVSCARQPVSCCPSRAGSGSS